MRLFLLKAFSYIEVVIATAILGIAVMGILMTVSSIKKPVAKTDRALVAAYYGQEILENLRAKVDARDWDSGDLSVTTTAPHEVSRVIDGITYTASYFVFEDPQSGGRTVELTVDYPGVQ